MNTSRAFVAGVLGGAAMSVLLFVVRLAGVPAELEMMLGTLFLEPGPAAFVVGLLMHLLISGLIALIYGWGFENVTRKAGWLTGMLFAVVHIIIGGFVMLAMPALHPMIPEAMPAPGAFMSGMGAMGVGLFIVEHLLYGAVVGATYGMAPRSAVDAAGQPGA